MLDNCEEGVDYEGFYTTCVGYNYWDGRNWKTAILEPAEGDVADYVILEGEKAEAILAEAADPEFISSDKGVERYESANFIFLMSYFAGDWQKYEVLLK